MGGKIYALLVTYYQNKFSQDSLRHSSVTTLQRFSIVILQVAEYMHYMKTSTEVRSSIGKETLLKTHMAVIDARFFAYIWIFGVLAYNCLKLAT